ncbi:hypothetical protein, partial [Streptococcus pneumoniae]
GWRTSHVFRKLARFSQTCRFPHDVFLHRKASGNHVRNDSNMKISEVRDPGIEHASLCFSSERVTIGLPLPN